MVALKVMRTVSTVFCIVFLRSRSLRDGNRSTAATNAEECAEGNSEECGTQLLALLALQLLGTLLLALPVLQLLALQLLSYLLYLLYSSRYVTCYLL